MRRLIFSLVFSDYREALVLLLVLRTTTCSLKRLNCASVLRDFK